MNWLMFVIYDVVELSSGFGAVDEYNDNARVILCTHLYVRYGMYN